MKVAIVLAILLAFSTLNQMRHLVHGIKARVKSGRQAHEHLDEVSFENNHSKNKVAVVDISGLISGEPWDRNGHHLVQLISDQLRLAGESDPVKAVRVK